ncbi:MAG TPA: hypothetical protein VG871_02110 [Vicinamibacterales bacterium]|nr:hypothetical protein [Vicinamibacterales bacterium]
MRALIIIAGMCVAALTWAAPAVAQEGFPLKGSWMGSWGPSKAHADDVLVVLNWDDKAIVGAINPGTDDMQVTNASLNPDGWLVHLEADGKTATGQPLHYTIDGRIENLAYKNRSVVGTWKDNLGESGQFKVTRQ